MGIKCEEQEALFIPCPSKLIVNNMFKGNPTTAICGSAKVDCYQASEVNLTRQTYLNEVNCNCLPACTSITYDVEITQAKLKLDDFYHALDLSNITKEHYKKYSYSVTIFITNPTDRHNGPTNYSLL